MPDPYSTSTTDSPACKRLFCGRSNDLTQVLNALAQGQSVALFGEHRIGNTILLFLLRDIVNGDVAHIEQDLLDGTLRAGLPALRAKLTQCTPVFLSLHDLNGHAAKAFGTLLLWRWQMGSCVRCSVTIYAVSFRACMSWGSSRRFGESWPLLRTGD